MSGNDQILKNIHDYASRWQMASGVSEGEYQWVMDYAEKQTEVSIKTIEYLDSKADAMMRYAGALITLLGLTMAYAISKDSPRGDVLFFLPVLLALLYSIWNALRCTGPTDQPRRPFIQEAFDYSQRPSGNKLYFMRSWIELEYRLWQLGDKKGGYIQTSLYGFLLAMVLFVFGVLGVIFKTPLTGIIPYSFLPLEYVLMLVAFLSVGGLYFHRWWKAAHPPLTDWRVLLPEIESFQKTAEPGLAG